MNHCSPSRNTLKVFTPYADGSLLKKREEQIYESVKREFERKYRDRMDRFPHRGARNGAYDKRKHDDNSKRVASTTDRGRYDSRRPSKNDPHRDRKSPNGKERSNGKDFKPCHLHGAESKHSYDECKKNPKNFAKTNKSNDYVKKRGNDAHYYDARRLSDGNESPNGNDTDAQSDGEIEDDNASESSRSASNYHVETPLKKRSDDVGHKSPRCKKEKSTCGADFGTEKDPQEDSFFEIGRARFG
jgi:hypothetical protein